MRHARTSPRRAKRAKEQRSALSLSEGWALVASLPRINAAKLTRENRVYIHPVCALGNDRFKCSKGWRLAGWNDAPWESAIGPQAIVYEKLTPAGSDDMLDSHDHFEPGLYWGHGNAHRMAFCDKLPEDMEAELGPWL